MKGGRVINDGLWRCLCPSWELTGFSRAVRRPIPRTTPSRTRQEPSTQKRWFGGVEAMEERSRYIQRAEAERPKVMRKNNTGQVEPQAEDRLLLAPTPPSHKTLESHDNAALIRSLKKLRDPAGYVILGGQKVDRFERILLFVETLISRGHPRDLFIYECVVDAMADPKGSSQALRKILQEAEAEGIQISQLICQGALAALAVHPNYALRQQVLDTMQEFWHHEGKGTNDDILVAMLREGQHEMAYDKFMKRLQSGGSFPLWMYDIFVLEFGYQGFLDEMVALLLRRKQAKGSDNGAVNLTYACLDLCSRGLHYEGTSYCWTSCVKHAVVVPSDGILENVLATAARAGDPTLAAEVHGIISERRRVQIHHYDALAEAFLNGSDVKGAVKVLCIMEQSGLKVLPENTRQIFKVLSTDLDALHKAHTEMLDNTLDKYAPVGVFSVLLEAAVKSGRHALAHSLYQDAEGLTGQRPSARNIEDMILNSDDAEKTGDYINDYNKLIRQDYLTVGRLETAYDRLVTISMAHKDWGLAIRFARASVMEHGRLNRHREPVWLEQLASLCIRNEYSGIWTLLDDYAKCGNRLAVSAIIREAREAKENHYKGKERGTKSTPYTAVEDKEAAAEAMLDTIFAEEEAAVKEAAEAAAKESQPTKSREEKDKLVDAFTQRISESRRSNG